jgi:flavorubredoxin
MPKAAVLYATRSGQTQKIADLIAEGIRFTGCEAKVINAPDIKDKDDLTEYDALIIGSPTYHGDMVKSIKNLLFMVSQTETAGKVGGAFGAFGWSGEASDRIYDTMQNVFGMDMVGAPLRLKTASIQGGMQMAQDYGREIGKKLGGQS